MAHKKGAGSTDNGRDSKSKRLGVKLFGGQKANAGMILVRQRGTKFHAGEHVYMGRDHTLHAAIDGVVVFKKTRNDRRFVSIEPFGYVEETVAEVKGAKKAAAPAPAALAAKKSVAAPVVVEEVVEAKVAAPAVVVEEVIEVVKAAPIIEVIEEAPAAEKKSATIKTVLGNIKQDDLKIVEGIGPKIEGLLKDGGIHTWAELAVAPVERLQEILNEAGPRYQMHDPGTWPAQAKFADEGKWEELKEYQDMLIGGRDAGE